MAAPVRPATPTGFVKMLADAKTDRVLGVHIIGPDAGEMIAEVVRGDGVRGLGRGHRAHLPRPSHASEAMKEAALAVEGGRFISEQIVA